MKNNRKTIVAALIIIILVISIGFFYYKKLKISSSPNLLASSVSTSTQSTSTANIVGKYSGFYGFPVKFFNESLITKEQMVKVTDAQSVGLWDMHNGVSPYNFCRIEYNPAVYGSTIPNGIQLGDSAFPGLNSGNPRWAVMGHEQGHNFFGGTSEFYITLATPGPFLQESLAVISAFYSYHYALKNYSTFGLTAKTLISLYTDMAKERAYQESMYNQYIQNGKIFNANDVLTSQVLDYKMITYGEQYGWTSFKRLSKAFANPMANKFTFQDDGVSDVERSTYIIAALSVSFNKDFRLEFKNLNFPIDYTLYTQIYNTLKANI